MGQLKCFVVVMVFALVGTQAMAQVEGKYCRPIFEGTECITFNANGSFLFEHWAPSYEGGNQFGAGEYRFTGSQLTLYFSDDAPHGTPGFELVSKETPKPIDQQVDVHLSSFGIAGGQPLPYAQVIVRNADGKRIGGISLDVNGQGKLRLHRADEPLTLTTEMVGYKPVSVKIVPDHHFTFEVWFEEDFTPIGSDVVRTYQVAGKSRSFIKMKGTHEQRFYEYQKE